MDATRRTFTLRRVAMMAALAALIPAGPAEAKTKAKSPVITKVTPMQVRVGQTLTITGSGFRKGKGRNSVGFKRDGAPVVMAKADVSTTRKLYVKVPSKLQSAVKDGPVRFRLRVLAGRFGQSYTSTRLSPVVSARPAAVATTPGGTDTGTPTAADVSPDATAPQADCDNDGTPNATDADDDNDLLPDALEDTLGTGSCVADSDGDGIEDGYEYQSALDLNDDDYQSPQSSLPYPGKRPYPNPLDSSDAGKDYDGDGLSDAIEFKLWTYTWKVTGTSARTLTPLSYSAGEQYSVNVRDANGRRQPALAVFGYDKTVQFVNWASAAGYRNVYLDDRGQWLKPDNSTHFTAGTHVYGLFDADRDGTESGAELSLLDRGSRGAGWLSDEERDEDADGLSNYDETVGRMQPEYWTSCYSLEAEPLVSYAGTDVDNPDTDGDGIRDGADDQDHDDVPNLVELSRIAASAGLNERDDKIDGMVTGGSADCVSDVDLEPDAPRHPTRFGKVNPFNPCDPDPDSRTCRRVVPFGLVEGPDWWSLQ
jgi:hypothetical protein